MRPIIIGRLYNNGNMVGYRLIDKDTVSFRTSHAKVLDVTYPSIVKAIQNGMKIENAVLSNGVLIGTQGDLNNYPVVGASGAIVILNNINNSGFTVVNANGDVKKAPQQGVVEYAKKFGVANATIYVENGEEFIRPIAGEFDYVRLNSRNVNNDSGVKLNIKIDGHKDSVNRNANARVQFEIKESDVFNCMSANQRDVLKKYYVWYTTRIFRTLAKSMRLNVSASKVERLSSLRSDMEWEFNGIVDSYLEGRFNAKCSLGHNLRYEYRALGTDDKGNVAQIIFGETCSGDFFAISKEDMRKLVKIRNIMSDELLLLSDVISSNRQEELIDRLPLLYDILKKLGTPKRFIEVFGNEVGSALANFVGNNIPIVESLAVLATEEIKKRTVGEFLNQLFEEDIFSNILKNVGNSVSGRKIIESINVYSEFMFTNRIEGYYSYDPFFVGHKRRDVGAYNDKTRDERKILLRNIRLLDMKGFKFEHYCGDRENYPNGKPMYDDKLTSFYNCIKYWDNIIKYTKEINSKIKECYDNMVGKIGDRVSIPHEYEPYYYIGNRLRAVAGRMVEFIVAKCTHVYSLERFTKEEVVEELKTCSEKQKALSLIEEDFNKYLNSKLEIIQKEEERKIEEQKKKEERQKVKDEEQKKDNDEDLLYEAINLIQKMDPSDKRWNDWSVHIVTDMNSRGITWNKMSDKQQMTVKKCIILLSDLDESGINIKLKDSTYIDKYKALKDKIESKLGSTVEVRICNDIVSNHAYDTELSIKQMWRLKKTLEQYEGAVK